MATKTKKEEILVNIRLPRDPSKPPRQFVSVGDRTWLVERGKNVKIPLCAYEVLRNAELAEDATVTYIESAPGNVTT